MNKQTPQEFLLNVSSATAVGISESLKHLTDDDLKELNLTRIELEQCVRTLKKFVDEVETKLEDY